MILLLLVAATALAVGVGRFAIEPPRPPRRDPCEACGDDAQLHVFGRDLCGPCSVAEDRRRWP